MTAFPQNKAASSSPTPREAQDLHSIHHTFSNSRHTVVHSWGAQAAIIEGSEMTSRASFNAEISASRRFFRSSYVERMSSHDGRRSIRYLLTSWSSIMLVLISALCSVSS